MLLLLPVHFLVHRVAPTSEMPSIDALGPSELDYEFVKTGLRDWPIRSWLLYGALVLSTTAHMADGIGIIISNWVPLRTPSPIKRRTAVLAAVALPVLAGLYWLSSEPAYAFKSLQDRHRAVFSLSKVFRF